MATDQETTALEEKPLWHICEICGKRALLTPSESYNAGWDYPPRMGAFGVISPRTCETCPMDGTVWWDLTMLKKGSSELTEAQLKTIERIQGEPESILPERSSE